MKKLLYSIIVLIFISTACSNDLKINSVAVYPDSVTLVEGDSMRINATINFSGGDYNEPNLITLDWSSDNVDVVTVDSTGYIRAHTVGNANIRVGCYDKDAQCAVTVQPDTIESDANDNL